MLAAALVNTGSQLTHAGKSGAPPKRKGMMRYLEVASIFSNILSNLVYMTAAVTNGMSQNANSSTIASTPQGGFEPNL